MIKILLALIILSGSAVANEYSPKLESYIKKSLSEHHLINTDRKNKLNKLAEAIQSTKNENKNINIIFICTHNSRRSHLSQIWAQTAANYFNIEDIYTYSGGTESTAFNPRAVTAIRNAGFNVIKTSDSSNPIYLTYFSQHSNPIINFSKIFDQSPNPTKDFIAVMTCGDADEKCPMVFGADFRIAITYEDPKRYDNTVNEASAYDQRCRQISREFLYLFSLIQ